MIDMYRQKEQHTNEASGCTVQKGCLGFDKACHQSCRTPATWRPDLQMATSLARSTMTPSMCALFSQFGLNNPAGIEKSTTMQDSEESVERPAKEASQIAVQDISLSATCSVRTENQQCSALR